MTEERRRWGPLRRGWARLERGSPKPLWIIAALFLAANMLLLNGTLVWSRLQAEERNDTLEAQLAEGRQERNCQVDANNSVAGREADAILAILLGLIAVSEGDDLSDVGILADAREIAALYDEAIANRDAALRACQTGEPPP